jgi:DNA-binding CsgD family transcriptional regulator
MLEALNLDGDEEAVYLALVDRSRVSADDLSELCGVDEPAAAIAGLLARGLIATGADGEDSYRAMSPQAVVGEALRDAEQSLAAVTAAVSALNRRLAQGQPAVPPIGEVECIGDRSRAQARMSWWRDHARRELRVVDPVGDEDADIPPAEPAGADVDVRGIYTQSVIDQPDQLDRLKWRAARGERARLLSTAPIAMTLVDSTAAILPARTSNRYRDGITVVRQTVLLDALVDYFEALWAIATPIDAFRAASHDAALDVDDRTLLSMMAAGFGDEKIARRLGVSEPAAQHRVARVIERLGAENRFQAGVRAARRGLF